MVNAVEMHRKINEAGVLDATGVHREHAEAKSKFMCNGSLKQDARSICGSWHRKQA